jgi:hypothetical protein
MQKVGCIWVTSIEWYNLDARYWSSLGLISAEHVTGCVMSGCWSSLLELHWFLHPVPGHVLIKYSWWMQWDETKNTEFSHTNCRFGNSELQNKLGSSRKVSCLFNPFLRIYGFVVCANSVDLDQLASVLSDQDLHCSIWFIRLFLTKKRTMQILIRCAGWLVSSMFAHSIKCVYMEESLI